MQEIDVTGTTAAAPSQVWSLLADSTTWPHWTPIERAVIDRPAAPDGTGELRSFTTGRVVVHEEVVERVPEARLVYVLRSGLAVKDYRAEITLQPAANGGTAIRWHTTFAPKTPGMGWIYRRALGKATRQFVDGLVTHAA